MNRIIQLLASGVIAVEIVENATQRGVCYSLAVRRLEDEAGSLGPLFTCRSADLHDLLAAMSAANSFIEHLLNGGNVAAWWDAQLSATPLLAA